MSAQDASGNTAFGFNGTVTLTDSNGNSLGDVTLTNGVGTLSATFNATGSYTLSASGTDPNTGDALTGSSNPVNVYGQATQLVLSGIPAGATAGTAFSVTVTAEASDGSGAQGYNGTVQLQSSDSRAVLPASVTLTNGVATFTAVLKTAGDQTLTATDTSDSSLTTSGTIAVAAGAASQFIISAPSSVSSGSAFSLTVKVEDVYGNVVTGYTGTVHFSLSGGSGSLPADYTFTAGDNGVHTFTGLTLTAQRKNRQQSDTITVSDSKNSSITGSAVVTV